MDHLIDAINVIGERVEHELPIDWDAMKQTGIPIPSPSPKTLLEMLHHIESIIKRVHEDLEREGNGHD